MKYLVMECHPGYAVVLDENGHFLKVANRRYEVGQTVTEVQPMKTPSRGKRKAWLYSLVAAAACLALVLGITLPGTTQPYASVYVKINPEVRIDVDRQDRVLALAGINRDGLDLIAEYDYRGKDLELVTQELVDRAIDMGYLRQDGQVNVSLDSQDETWVEAHTASISHHLQTHLQEELSATVQVQAHHEEENHGETHDETSHSEHPTEADTDHRAGGNHSEGSHGRNHGNGHDG